MQICLQALSLKPRLARQGGGHMLGRQRHSSFDRLGVGEFVQYEKDDFEALQDVGECKMAETVGVELF